MRKYVIKSGNQDADCYLVKIEGGIAANWGFDKYGRRIRTSKNPVKKYGEEIVRTATYKPDISEAMVFDSLKAAREYIEKEPMLRFCVPVLMSKEATAK